MKLNAAKLIVFLAISTQLFALSELRTVPKSVGSKAKNETLNVTQKSLGAQVVGLDSDNSDWSDSVEAVSEKLLGEDSGEATLLPVGTTKIVVQLENMSFLSKFTSHSFGALGTVSLRTKLKGEDKWSPSTEAVSITERKPFFVPFPFVETQQVEITFTLNTAGPVGKFAFLGEDRFEQVTPRDDLEFDEQENEVNENTKTVPFDHASIPNGAQITHVSSGDPSLAYGMIDDDVSTSYDFDPEEEEHVVLFDLTKEKTLNRVSVVLEAKRGKLQVYWLNTLPSDLTNEESTEENQVGSAEITAARVNISDNFFDPIDPEVEQVFKEEVDRVQIDLEPKQTRFVIFRWTREKPMPKIVRTVQPDGINISDREGAVKSMKTGTKMETGDTIKTGLKSQIIAVLPNGDLFQIQEDSEATIDSFNFEVLTSKLTMSATLDDGAVVGKFDNLKTVPGSSFELTSTVGVTGVSGTRFLVEFKVNPSTGEFGAIFAVAVGEIGLNLNGTEESEFSVQAGGEITARGTIDPATNAVTSIEITSDGPISEDSASRIETSIAMMTQAALEAGFAEDFNAGGSAEDYVFRVYEISLIGDVPEEFGTYDFVPRNLFLESQASAGEGTSSPGPTPPPPPISEPELDLISP